MKERCKYCTQNEAGEFATVCWDRPDWMNLGVTSAELVLNDGITIILRTPMLETDQRLHHATNFCPMCGRKYINNPDGKTT